MKFNTRLIDKVRDHLITYKKTVAVAESVTAGFLQAALSQGKDASHYFQGGITTYNLGHKCRHLGIEPVHAEQCDCVSETVAEQMAVAACKLFISDFGIGVTGYASPAPEKNINELYAFISIANTSTILITKELKVESEDPLKVQIQYVNEALKLLDKVFPMT